jgi:cytochrome c-type biogenesis protein CcmH/NrfF
MLRSKPNLSLTTTNAGRGVGTHARSARRPLQGRGHGTLAAVFAIAILFLLTASSVRLHAQTEAQIESDQVKRVGTHLSCQCGACQENLNCLMSSGQCHFCKPARTKIYQAQTSGQSDAQIIQSFITEYGEKIFRHDPNNYFWTVPYISLGLGLLAIIFVLRKIKSHPSLKPAAAGHAPPPDNDPELARYRDAIEKETERLE